jgi:hypothetical protein
MTLSHAGFLLKLSTSLNNPGWLCVRAKHVNTLENAGQH